MDNKLSIIDGNSISIDVKTELDGKIDSIINSHKNNRQVINRMVFDSVALLTAADTFQNTLNNKGFFKRLIGRVTGSNLQLENQISSNKSQAQYLAQQTLQKLAEQNLLTFDLLATINNKFNLHVEQINKEIENIYQGLNKFFKLYQSQMIQTELRLETLERNVNLLTWSSSIEYQMFHETPYMDLDELSKLICIVRDFYEITSGDWSTADLLLLKSVLNQLNCDSNNTINLWKTIISINESKTIKNKLLGKEYCIDDEIVYNNLILLESLYKFDKLNTDEEYTVFTCKHILEEKNLLLDTYTISQLLTKSYIENMYNINVNTEITYFDFVMEMLFNLQQGILFIKDTNTILLEETDIDQVEDYEELSSELEASKEYKTVGIEAYYSKNYDLAFSSFKENYDKGDFTELFYLAACYLNGYGVAIDYEMCFDLIDIALEHEIYDVYVLLSELYYEGFGCNKDYEKAKYYAEIAIERAIIPLAKGMALNNLGILYILGSGVEKNVEKGISLVEQAIDYGYDSAANNLGNFYFGEAWGEQNLENAFAYYLKGAELMNPNSLNMLGYFYEKGLIKNIAYRKAINYYKLAYENGYIAGAYNYARFFETGIGVDADYKEAFKYYKIAADADIDIAVYKVYHCYYDGYGVEKDRLIADIMHTDMVKKGTFDKIRSIERARGYDIKGIFKIYGKSELEDPIIESMICDVGKD